ncbi:MAG: helix-turn-helix domain-containing protein [Actinomycetota bacterium]
MALESLPLAQMLRDERHRQGLSLGEMARRMRKAAGTESTHCSVTRQAIHAYEHGRIPHPAALRWLAAALDLPPEQLFSAAEWQRVTRRLPTSSIPLLMGENDRTTQVSDALIVRVPTQEGGVITVLISRRELLMALGVGGVYAPYLHKSDQVVVSADTVTELNRTLDGYMIAGRTVAPGRLINPLIGRVAVISAMHRATSDALRPGLMITQARYAEFLSWMHEEQGDLASAVWWIDRAADWARTAGWLSMVAFASVRKSVIATMHMADGERTVDWAEQAMNLDGATSGVLRFAAAQLAYGHALNGDLDASRRALDIAAAHYDQAARHPHDGLPIGAQSVLDVDLNWATCNVFAGSGDLAVDVFAPRMQAVESASRRAYAIHAARLAHAHALAGNPDEACASAIRALEAAEIIESATARSELKRVAPVMSQRWPDRSDVRDVSTYLSAIA